MTADQTELVPRCVNHPDVETRLTCSNCGDPICPKCMVSTPVGQKCPRCARQPGRARGTPTAALALRAFGAGLAAAAAGALLLSVVPRIGFFIIALAYGYAVGSATRWGARRRTHQTFGIVAVAALVVGLAAVSAIRGLSPLSPALLLDYVLGGVIAYLRASGIW